MRDKQHRSKDAFRDDKKVPTHDPCGVNADEEVEDYELERTTVTGPFIERWKPPRWDRWSPIAWKREQLLRDDVVTIMSEPATGSRIASMSTGKPTKGDDETDCYCPAELGHQNSEPTDIKAVISKLPTRRNCPKWKFVVLK